MLSIGIQLDSVIKPIKHKIFGDDLIRIRTEIEPGPTSRQYGFTETAIKVTVVNNSPIAAEIHDIRLMIDKKYGVSLPKDAPVPRHHATLPQAIEPGLSNTWYFGTERTSSRIKTLYPGIGETCMLRARVETVAGKVYRGDKFEFFTGINAYFLN